MSAPKYGPQIVQVGIDEPAAAVPMHSNLKATMDMCVQAVRRRRRRCRLHCAAEMVLRSKATNQLRLQNGMLCVKSDGADLSA